MLIINCTVLLLSLYAYIKLIRVFSFSKTECVLTLINIFICCFNFFNVLFRLDILLIFPCVFQTLIIIYMYRKVSILNTSVYLILSKIKTFKQQEVKSKEYKVFVVLVIIEILLLVITFSILIFFDFNIDSYFTFGNPNAFSISLTILILYNISLNVMYCYKCYFYLKILRINSDNIDQNIINEYLNKDIDKEDGFLSDNLVLNEHSIYKSMIEVNDSLNQNNDSKNISVLKGKLNIVEHSEKDSLLVRRRYQVIMYCSLNMFFISFMAIYESIKIYFFNKSDYETEGKLLFPKSVRAYILHMIFCVVLIIPRLANHNAFFKFVETNISKVKEFQIEQEDMILKDEDIEKKENIERDTIDMKSLTFNRCSNFIDE